MQSQSMHLGISLTSNIHNLTYEGYRVKSGNFGHQVNSDIHLQTVEIQMRLIRIFIVCLVHLVFIPIIKIGNKQGCCPNLPDV